MLHLRASGDVLARKDSENHVERNEIDEFANWVFGPGGLPRLQVFAYGDFTFPNEGTSVLYCRNDVGSETAQGVYFKELDSSNVALWEWVGGNWDTLSACAYKAHYEV